MSKGFFYTFRHNFARGKFLYFLISILFYILLSPFLKDFSGIHTLLDIFISAVLLSGIYAVSEGKSDTVIMVMFVFPTVVLIWILHFIELPSLALSSNCLAILFLGYAMIRILGFIFKSETVTGDVIFAAIVVYLLIGVIWGIVFRSLETIQPGSFSIGEGLEQYPRIAFTYYSFVTLTTLGYGDINPLSPQAGTLAILEAIIGQLYLAVLIARLVGTYISHSRESKEP
jgi:hypothetical protein